jgi:superfamily II DNA or RNA helicase
MPRVDAWPEDQEQRNWAERCYREFLNSSSIDYFLVATPGAGKTRAALRCAHEYFRIGRATRLVVVVPSEYLKLQWSKAAAKVGIHLNPYWSNRDVALAGDYHGCVVTYQQVASNPAAMQWLVGNAQTFVIPDEVHHAGDGDAWGDAMAQAFDGAIKRLPLSGTPFRSRTNAIYGLRYDKDGICRPDFTYSYADALRDGVCRPLFFPAYEGDMEWYWKGEQYKKTFRDKLSDHLSAKRLLTAIGATGDWIRQVFRDADERLTWVRQSHPEAGGLIVAMDVNHANALAEIIQKICGEPPTVVTVDTPDALNMIEAHARSLRRWIVAIKMLSEGVDVPRLRVGVYASNILTEMYFRQVVGRLVRVIDGVEDQNAYLYVPHDPSLIEYVQRIKEERNHQLEEECREATGTSSGDDSTPFDPTSGDDRLLKFIPIASSGRRDNTYTDGESISPAEIIEAERLRSEAGIPGCTEAAALARLIRMARSASGATSPSDSGPTPSAPHEPEPVFLRKKKLIAIIGRLVAQLREMSDGQLDYETIYAKLKKFGNVSQGDATEDQLKDRILHLEQWIKGYPYAY